MSSYAFATRVPTFIFDAVSVAVQAARRGGASNNGRRPYALGALYEKACLWELKEAGVLRTLGDDAPVQAAADREQL